MLIRNYRNVSVPTMTSYTNVTMGDLTENIDLLALLQVPENHTRVDQTIMIIGQMKLFERY